MEYECGEELAVEEGMGWVLFVYLFSLLPASEKEVGEGEGEDGEGGEGGDGLVLYVPCMTRESSTLTLMPSAETCTCARGMNPTQRRMVYSCRAELVTALRHGRPRTPAGSSDI